MSEPFDAANGLIVVTTRLSGPLGQAMADLALDTGAVQTLLNWDIAMLIGYDPAAVSQRTRIITASGIEYAPLIVVDRIEALGLAKLAFPLLCHTLPPGLSVMGVLGLDFFRGNRLTLDFQAGQIDLQ